MDIECAGRKVGWGLEPRVHAGAPHTLPQWPFREPQGHFPEAEKDPVIQIASMVTEQGQERPLVRNVMTLNSCAPIVGAEVMAFSREEDLLKVASSYSRQNTVLCPGTCQLG